MKTDFRIADGILQRINCKLSGAFALTEVFHPAGKSHRSAFTLAEFFSPHPTIQRRAAFTLAEVLITLGIIGVVAAMTMPTLMANYKKKVTVNKLKKSYAEILQAVHLSEAEYGPIDTWDWASQPGNSDLEKVYYLLENYIVKRLKTTKTCKTEEFANCGYTEKMKFLNGSDITVGSNGGLYITTASGYSILFHPGGWGETTYFPHVLMLVDIDGPMKGENKVGKDVFVVALRMSGYPQCGIFFNGGSQLNAHLQRDDLKNDPTDGCNIDANGYNCGALIMHDGWEINSDYPW